MHFKKPQIRKSRTNSERYKPNKTWVDVGGEIYNKSMKSWLQDSYVKMYLTHNDGKSVFAKDLSAP